MLLRFVRLGALALPLLVTGLAHAEDATTALAITTPHPTFHNLAVDWAIDGDDDADGVVTVRYRKQGDATARDAMPLLRVPAGSNAGFSWANRHAGSIFGLEPGTTYDIELALVDPDGGDTTQTITATTRALPTDPPSPDVITVTPASIGAALASAAPGDVILLGDGTYGDIVVTADGAADDPIVLRAENPGGAVVDGQIRLDGRSFVHVEDLVVQAQIKMNDATSVMIARCTIDTAENGIIAYGSGVTDSYIVDNVISGATQWNEGALGVDGDNVGEGVQITGPGNVVAFNRIRGFRDCVSLMEGGEARDQVSIDIYGNDLDLCADDGIEADFSMGNVRVYGNRIDRSFIALSSQPSLGGPTYFVRNVLYNTVFQAFKLQRSSVGDVGLHNTSIKSGDAFSVFTTDVFSRSYFRNNLFIGGPGGSFGGYDSGDGNVMSLRAADATCSFDFDGYGSIDTGTFRGVVGDASFESLAEMQARTTEAHAVSLGLDAFAAQVTFPADPFADPPMPSFALNGAGAAVDKATPLANVNDGWTGAAPDLGAYEVGLPEPTYGPDGDLAATGSGSGSGATSSSASSGAGPGASVSGATAGQGAGPGAGAGGGIGSGGAAADEEDGSGCSVSASPRPGSVPLLLATCVIVALGLRRRAGRSVSAMLSIVALGGCDDTADGTGGAGATAGGPASTHVASSTPAASTSSGALTTTTSATTASSSVTTGPACDALVEGKDTSVPTLGTPRPPLGEPFADEHYGFSVVRGTDASQVTDHDPPTWVRHEYSRRQAFNADSTRAYMMSSNGWGRLYDVETNGVLSFAETIVVGEPQEPNWHPTDPNKLYYFDAYGSGLEIFEYDVTTRVGASVRDLTSRVQAIFPDATGMWTKQEGRPSNDGKIWCLEVGHTEQPGSNFRVDGLVSYDFEADAILGSLAVDENPDHVSTSPLGNYCVPSWGLGKGTRAYALDFSTFTQLHDRSEHSDLAVTATGDEVLVYTAYDGAGAGAVQMVRLDDGTSTPLFELYGENHSLTAMHFSGAARDRPGYVVASFYGCREDYGNAPCDPTKQWFYDKVVAVSLEANPRIYPLAHTHYGDAGYFAETQATTNRDLTKVLFVSSWESEVEDDVASYLVDLGCALP